MLKGYYYVLRLVWLSIMSFDGCKAIPEFSTEGTTPLWS